MRMIAAVTAGGSRIWYTYRAALLVVGTSLAMAGCETGKSPVAPSAEEPGAGYSYAPRIAPSPALSVTQGASGALTLSSTEGQLPNGGFEEGAVAGATSFPGWSVYTVGSGAIFAQEGTTAPLRRYTVPAPPEGRFAAMVDQTNPGTNILSQVVTVPAGGATLYADVFVASRTASFHTPASLNYQPSDGSRNQQFRIDVMDPDAPITDVGPGVLAMLYRTEVGDPTVWSAYRTLSFSLDAFAGETVRLRFAEVDNVLYFQLGLDNVRMVASATAPPANNAPVANAGGPYEATEGDVVTLSADGSTDPDGDALTYEWDLDNDGEYDDANGVTATLAVPQDGVFPVAVRVSDPGGLSATANTVVTVANAAPVFGEITGPARDVPAATVITVSAPFTDAGVEDTHQGSVQWITDGPWEPATVGGGVVTASAILTHGTYQPSLRVQDDAGAFDEVTLAASFRVLALPLEVSGGGWVSVAASACQLEACPGNGKLTMGFSVWQRESGEAGGDLTAAHHRGMRLHATGISAMQDVNGVIEIRGEATVNDAAGFEFALDVRDAGDGGRPNDSARLRVWRLADGVLVYDSGTLASLGGGNLTVTG